ncbi:ATP-dependent DNA helicase sgs1 [Podila epicladia]|nr:ATP-dependent DNA helicase sgs1 [Podila epicladia]
MRSDLRIDAYFSARVPSAKDNTMLNFIDSKIDVLLATDACGMGCDISDVITVIQYDLPQDLTSLVQRFGRAARGHGIRGLAILLAPPITNDKYNKRPCVLEFVKAMTEKEKRCRWEVVDQYLGNTFRPRSSCCDVCLGGPSRSKTNLPAPAGSAVVIPRGKSTDRKQEVGRKKLLEWRKTAYNQWVEGEEPMADLEVCFLPDKPLTKLCQKLFAATTPDVVKAIADSCDWVPMKFEHFTKIAQVVVEALIEANNTLDD